MKRTTVGVVALTLFGVCASVSADYSVGDRGLWPKNWPKELEALRGRSRKFEGPMVLLRHYEIPFQKREAFEAMSGYKTPLSPKDDVRGWKSLRERIQAETIEREERGRRSHVREVHALEQRIASLESRPKTEGQVRAIRQMRRELEAIKKSR